MIRLMFADVNASLAYLHEKTCVACKF